MTDTASQEPENKTHQDGEYTVLARKYRPTTFESLIGQEAMVRTLTNAIHAGRLAHAFVLTGVRGVGKTTTARIIARVLNCIGPDGTGGATAEPCGVCEHCLAIAEDRHVDVMEMDAASRTGVDDIRELIEGVRYRPTSARYKIYIIDEVHMLSKNAFNALLKTLEEPPEHVKFIFATTEIRKIPVTVLSRCQRFDLRRVDAQGLSAHFAGIAKKEGADITDGALALIARAADGSVRDGLSLLDQAIANRPMDQSGDINEAQVRDMLGLADRSQTFDVLEAVLKGQVEESLNLFDNLYKDGADPATILEDLLEITHWLTRIKVAPTAIEDPGVAEIERVRGGEMAGRLPMAAIARAWQALLKGLGEVRIAPSPVQAAEMVLVRLAFLSDMPTPGEALKAMEDGGKGSASDENRSSSAQDFAASTPAPVQSAPAAPDAPPAYRESPSPEPPPFDPPPLEPPPPEPPRAAMGGGAFDSQPQPEIVHDTEEGPVRGPETLEEVAELAGRLNPMLRANIINNIHLVSFEPGRIEFCPGDHAPRELSFELSKFLTDYTSRRWVVTVSGEAGQPTLQQQADAAIAEEKARAAEHPLVKKVLETFPGAAITDVRHPDTES